MSQWLQEIQPHADLAQVHIFYMPLLCVRAYVCAVEGLDYQRHDNIDMASSHCSPQTGRTCLFLFFLTQVLTQG